MNPKKKRPCKHPRKERVTVDSESGGREEICAACNESLRYLPPVQLTPFAREFDEQMAKRLLDEKT